MPRSPNTRRKKQSSTVSPKRQITSPIQTGKQPQKNKKGIVSKVTEGEESPSQISSSSESSSASVASTFSKDNNEDSPQQIAYEEPSKSSELTATKSTKGYSRLFSPYRTLGIVARGPFHLIPNQNSANAVVCAAIGDRFHMVQCDRLHPVLVSHAIPAPLSSLENKASVTSSTLQQQQIQHVISDNSLSLTLVAHGAPNSPRQVSLFQRTRPIGSIAPAPDNNTNDWTIVDLLHLGRIQQTIKEGEKRGLKENVALAAIVLSKGLPLPDDGVPIMGEEDDDDSTVSSADSDSSSSDKEDIDKSIDSSESRGQIVLVLASRTGLTFYKRIDLSMFPSFCPQVALHPPTYVNKIVLAGSCTQTNKDAMILLNIRSGQLIHTFTCLSPSAYESNAAKSPSEVISLEASPAIDTIAVGTSKGMVHLVNLKMDVLLFSLSHTSKSGKPTPVTSMSFRSDGSAYQYGIAPLAVGRADGTITVWDLTPPEGNDMEDDEARIATSAVSLGRTILCEMEGVHYPGGVHKIQYLPQEPLLLSTGTRSNSILMHIFDNPDHSGRILRQRKGHTAPPKFIRYLHPGAGAGGGVLVNSADGTDAAACQILSGGSIDRTLRIFSTVRSVLDKEYSQGKGLEKRARQLGMKSKAELLLPPVSTMATSEIRSRDWGDLVTIHKDHAFAYVWSSKRGAQSGPVLRQDHWNVSAMKKAPPASAHATSVTISTCGNFALVGTRGGSIFKYNIQSGNTRGSYPPAEEKKGRSGRRQAGDIRTTFKALEKKMKISNKAANLDKEEEDQVLNAKKEVRRATKLKAASHAGFAVTGIAVDGVNKTLISVGEDAKLILWNFKTHYPYKKCPIALPAQATKLCHIRDSDMAAIALADYSALLFDCSSLTIIRRFGSGNKASRHTGPISDLGFSPDGRTLYTASLDGTIRVWDVPTNTCVDWLGFGTPPTSLTISPTGEFLATTHSGRLGISLWSDKSFYQTVHVDGAQELGVPASMDEPSPLAEVDLLEEDRDNALKRLLQNTETKEKVEIEDEELSGPVVAKEEGLITMSGLPPAHWKNLFHLELVKQRNKPKEPPKKPPTAPFFLQWRSGETLDGASGANTMISTENGEEKDDEEWDAVWSDDDVAAPDDGAPLDPSSEGASKRKAIASDEEDFALTKRRKVTHYRSHLAALLEECKNTKPTKAGRFKAVTEHIATQGPSAIDVSLSTLCSGMHDLEDGLPLLILACRWLIEACKSRERFEAVNAYLHRFLHLHDAVLAGIKNAERPMHNFEPDAVTAEEEKQTQRERNQRIELLKCIDTLKAEQRNASEKLQGKMQNTLCLLRHFSRMI